MGRREVESTELQVGGDGVFDFGSYSRDGEVGGFKICTAHTLLNKVTYYGR